MNVSLAKVKVCGFASQETTCFEAQLVIDGVVAGTVRNEGNGGANYCYFKDPNVEKSFYAFAIPNLRYSFQVENFR